MKWLWALALLATPLHAQEFAAAGVPRSLAAARDYPALFAHLEENGITLFFPTFQYAESPTPLSYGYEADFLPPCSPDDPAFKALRESRVKLIIPGPLLMPNLPDTLRQVLTCADGQVAAISNFDEPVSQNIPFEMVARLYRQVKEVDPALDVLMVHAPIPNDNNEVPPATLRREYLDSIRRYSEMADIVGFDIYPYPEALVQIGAPTPKGETQAATQVIAAYKRWLGENLPNKRHLMVLQGFALRDMFADLSAAWSIAPNARQLAQMLVQAGDSELIIWWGQAALRTTSQPPWPEILRLTAP